MLMIAYGAFFVAVEQICKVKVIKHIDPLEKDDSVKETGEDNPAEKKEKRDGFLGFLEDLTPIGLGVSASFIAEFFYTANAGGFGNEFKESAKFSSDIVMDLAIFSLAQIIGFVIFFYIVYGILSLVKFQSKDEHARRNAAGWTTVAVDLLLIFSTL